MRTLKIRTRVRLALLAFLASIALVAPIATAPPAQAANLYGFPNAWLVAKTLNFDDNGNHIGDITVWFDGYSIAAYFEHTGPAWQRQTWTSITLCITQWYDGPNVGIDDYGNKQTCGNNEGNFQEYAGPAIPNPSAGIHRNSWDGYKPWRATAQMLWGNKYYTFYLNAAGGRDGFHPFNCCYGR